MMCVFEGYAGVLGPHHNHTIIALQNLIDVMKLNGETDTAEKLMRELIDLKKSLPDANKIEILKLEASLSSILRENQKYQEAGLKIN